MSKDKTPEQMAKEYAKTTYEYWVAKDAFLAGYKAAQNHNAEASKMGWISVKDRLPDVRVPVLVWTTDYAFVVQRDEYLPGRFNWIIDRETRLVGEAVTHWQKLPEPAKEGK